VDFPSLKAYATAFEAKQQLSYPEIEAAGWGHHIAQKPVTGETALAWTSQS
jgi:hypothetical protein